MNLYGRNPNVSFFYAGASLSKLKIFKAIFFLLDTGESHRNRPLLSVPHQQHGPASFGIFNQLFEKDGPGGAEELF